MAQIFPPWSNTAARASLVALVAVVCAAGWLVYELRVSSYATGVGLVRDQPVPFSHKHHVSGLGIDCRYCHVSVETGAFAGIPPTRTCMTCHSQVWTNAKVLEPVREADRSGAPLPWTRVNALPDYVFFNHSVHIHAGVSCADCHGDVAQMPLTAGQYPAKMRDCLACHRQPERFPGGRRDIARYVSVLLAGSEAHGASAEQVERHAKGLLVRRITDCYACHR